MAFKPKYDIQDIRWLCEDTQEVYDLYMDITDPQGIVRSTRPKVDWIAWFEQSKDRIKNVLGSPTGSMDPIVQHMERTMYDTYDQLQERAPHLIYNYHVRVWISKGIFTQIDMGAHTINGKQACHACIRRMIQDGIEFERVLCLESERTKSDLNKSE